VLERINQKLILIVPNPLLGYSFTMEIEAHIIWLLGISFYFFNFETNGKIHCKERLVQKGHRDLGKTNPSQPKPQSLPRRVLGILIYLKTI